MTAYGESPGSFLSYATSDGYIDGYLRGLQLGLLSRSDYETLTQCDTLDGMFFPSHRSSNTLLLYLHLTQG